MKRLSLIVAAMLVMTACLLTLAPAAPTAAAAPAANPGAVYTERWNYIVADPTTAEGTATFIDRLKLSKAVGCTHIMMPEGRAFRVDDQKPDYLENVAKIKACAKELNLTLVPSVISTGYFGHYFHYDGNLAAGCRTSSK